MTTEKKQQIIRQCAEAGEIRWSTHATGEAAAEDLDQEQIVEALKTCEIIEDYPQEHRKLPDCLVVGWLPDGLPVHACVGVDETNRRILIITVYRPTEEKWENDWRTRKRT
jgi:hypothetical protein